MHFNLYRFERTSPFLGVADVVIRIKTVQQGLGIDTRHLGLIPQRLPSLNYRAAEFADKGYAVTDIDALTGAQRFHNIRFDDSGQVFNINPSSITPELRAMLTLSGAPNYPQLNAYMLNSALDRLAIAPLWEVKTAKMQETAGDPNAGVTEEERAAKAGLSAAADIAYVQSHPNDVNASNKRIGRFVPIGIDLDTRTGNTSGVGNVSTLSNARTAASFDWDGLGYQKQTGWIARNDGFLVLDRNFNQSADNATELLSNPLVADPAKGLRSLAAFDANADGSIDAIGKHQTLAKRVGARRYENNSWLRKVHKGWRHISCVGLLAEPANSAWRRAAA